MEQVLHKSSENAALRAELICDAAGLDRIREQWNALFEKAHNAAAPLHYDWISTWLEVYGARYVQSPNGLRVICIRRDEELVGVMPLYLRRNRRLEDGGRRLGFLSTGESVEEEVCADYMDVLCLEEEKQRCVEQAWSVMCDQMQDYDRIELSDIADDCALAKWARQHAGELDLEISPRGVCPIADLDGGMEAYLARLSHKTRAQCRRLLRQADEAVRFEVADSRNVEEFFDDLVELHQHRWAAAGESGVFASVPFARFHRLLARKWVPQGRALISRVRLDGQTIAVKYGFRVKGKFDYYQSGVRLDEPFSRMSPGMMSLLLLLRHLTGDGVKVFDFLRGSAAYKQRLATGAQPLVEVRKVLWSWRTAVGIVASLGFRCWRKAGRLMTRSRPRRQTPAEALEGQ